MALPDRRFDTGPATLVDSGILSYNGCVFSPLFETNVSGVAVKDNAGRTVKFMEYTITADGYATLPDGEETVNPVMITLRDLLTAQAGHLIYFGRGMDLNVNGTIASPKDDVAWGPVPELLEFQPLGGGRSAKVKWQVKTRLPEIAQGATYRDIKRGGIALPLLQFNYESSVSYNEDGYATLSERGTMEVPLTRKPNQKTRTLTRTVDDMRSILDDVIFSRIDLSRFRVTRRDFNISRDRRTMEWDYSMEEKSYMDLPPMCPVARGNFSVRPAKSGAGLVMWLCTLRASYTVRADAPRRWAWTAFLSLLRIRMSESKNADLAGVGRLPPIRPFEPARTPEELTRDRLGDARYAWLIDFSVDEGLYLDSKTTSFSATWRLITTLRAVLLASGVWRKVPEYEDRGPRGRRDKRTNLWAISMRRIMGSKSFSPDADSFNASADLIVDFGSDLSTV